ncbi:MAG TPA: VCBS repeat-containing protein, partial [Desulfobacterales bacterium]|nr:VCBS repeat-containing protein [Desulfobacterales bacterium]
AGIFTVAGTVAGQTGATALVAGDWDGDGALDLAVANFGANQVAILENDGAGIFTVAGTVAGQVNVSALAAGDWGGDGALDLAAANKGADSVDVLKNRLP